MTEGYGRGAAPSAGRLSLRRLLRSASGISLATLVSPALALPAGILAARWLGPDRYGRAQAVLFFFLLASLLRTGIFEGGVRAYVQESATGNDAAALRAQNVAFTLESIASAIPGLALLFGALVVDDSIRRAGFLLAPLAVVATSISGYLSALHVARERFPVVARAALVRAVLAPAVMLLGIAPLGAIAIVVGPLVADVVTITLLLRARPALGLRPELDASVARPLLRVGLPLGLAAVTYWAYRLVGSGSIALTRAPADYGIFAFAATPVTVLARGIASLHTVLMPAVWGEMADERRVGAWGRPAARATMLLALAAGALTSVSQAGFGPLVHVVAPQFARSIPILEVLAFNVLLLSVAAVPSLVLDSAVVNRQARHLGIWVAALALNLVANVAVLAAGGGILGVAVNDICVQGLAVVAVFVVARPYLPAEWPGSLVVRWVLACTAVTGALLVAVRLVLPHPEDVSALVPSIVVRMLVAAVPWAAMAYLFHRIVGEQPTPKGAGDPGSDP